MLHLCGLLSYPPSHRGHDPEIANCLQRALGSAAARALTAAAHLASTTALILDSAFNKTGP